MNVGDRVVAHNSVRFSAGVHAGKEGILLEVFHSGLTDEYWWVKFGTASWHMYSVDLVAVNLEPEPYEAWFVD